MVEHHKGNRAAHYHFVFSQVHPVSGRAIKSHDKLTKDHIAARLLELKFKHPIVLAAEASLNERVLKELEKYDIDTSPMRDAMMARDPSAPRGQRSRRQTCSNRHGRAERSCHSRLRLRWPGMRRIERGRSTFTISMLAC